MTITHRRLAHPGVEVFEGKKQPEILRAVADWLDGHPHASVIGYRPLVNDDSGETIEVIYEEV